MPPWGRNMSFVILFTLLVGFLGFFKAIKALIICTGVLAMFIEPAISYGFIGAIVFVYGLIFTFYLLKKTLAFLQRHPKILPFIPLLGLWSDNPDISIVSLEYLVFALIGVAIFVTFKLVKRLVKIIA